MVQTPVRKPAPTQVRISTELRERAKVRAAEEHVSLQEFIDRAVAAALGNV